VAAAAARTKANERIDALLGATVPRPQSAKPPTKPRRKPMSLALKDWASSHVAAYRVGLFLSYVSMMYFGTSAFIAGIPTFEFTTPEGWTPIWSASVVLGGFVGALGSLKAGAEPLTIEVRLFNRIELTGAILLFLTLGTYAALLLILGYGYGDTGRASVGAGFFALAINPTVRMIWLIFRPRFLRMTPKDRFHTGPIIHVPTGYALVKVDELGRPLPSDYVVSRSPEDRYGPKGN